jgi:hypothetical protein
MKDKQRKLKIDFNLLMSGTWVLRENAAVLELEIFEKEVDGGKVVISSPIGLPGTKEARLLDYLMMQSQEQGWAKVIEFPSLNSLAKATKFSTKNSFMELRISLRLLRRLTIEFHNCFIDTGVLKYFEGDSEIVEIGIIQGFQIRRNKEKRNRGYPVKIVFDDNFLALCQHSFGYKLIPYTPIKNLRDTAYALYKWAWRWYNTEKGYGERWIGDSKSLIQWYKNELNSTANYKYPSKVIERINSAIKQLNNNPEVPFYFQVKKINNSYKIEIYRKEKINTKREIPYDKLPHVLKQTIINLAKRKKHIQNEYAFARSMSWKEIESAFKKVAVVSIPKDAWEVFEIVFQTNPKEKEEFDKIVLAVSHSKATGEVYISAEKSKFKSKNILTKLLNVAMPKWKEYLHDAVKWIEGEKVLAMAKS